MQFSMLLLIGFFSTALGTHKRFYSDDLETQQRSWAEFKSTHGRMYDAHEEPHRFSIFLENLKTLDTLQSEAIQSGSSAKFAVTRFSDLTKAEYKERFLNTKVPTEEEMAAVPVTDILGDCTVTQTSKNWAGVLTTPVKDQGNCGSCWSFAAAEQVESDILRLFGSTEMYSLSVEQLLDCNTNYPQTGCNGGNVYHAFQYLRSHYLETNASYPYASYVNTTRKSCNYNADNGVTKLTTSSLLAGESCMANYVQNYGPLSALVNADSWSNYGGGVWSGADCGNGVINHAVQIVGVNIPGNYWIVRNTWGTGWGQDNGYIWLQYGVNACNISMAGGQFTTPTLGGPPQTDDTTTSSSSSSSSGLSMAATGGIIGAAIVVLLFLAGVIFYYCRVVKVERPTTAGNAEDENASMNM